MLDVKKGDKLICKKDIGKFNSMNEICNVIDVSNKMVTFVFGKGLHMGVVHVDEVEQYFDKYENDKNDDETLKYIKEINNCLKEILKGIEGLKQSLDDLIDEIDYYYNDDEDDDYYWYDNEDEEEWEF